MVCLQHLRKHSEKQLQKLRELIDQIKELQPSVDHLSIDSTIEKAEQDLESWKDMMLKYIDVAYNSSREKLDQYKTEMASRIDGFKTHYQTDLDRLLNQSKKFLEEEQVLSQVMKPFLRQSAELRIV